MYATKIAVAALMAVLPTLARAADTQTFDQRMQPILQSYLSIHDALASDRLTGVVQAAQAIVAESDKVARESVSGAHAAHYKELPARLASAGKALAAVTDIEAAREAFKELSRAMSMWGTMSKPPGVEVVFCSMAKGSWLQKKGPIRNPYYGAHMLACGEVVGGDTGSGTP